METGGETGGPFYTYIKRLNELVVTMYRFSCRGAPTDIVYILFFFMLNVEKNPLLVSLSVAVAWFWFCRVAWRVDSATLMSRHY